MTNLRLGRALGDGLRRSLASQEIVAFDSLGAPFWFKLSSFTGSSRGPSSLLRLRELTAESPITRLTDGRLATFTPDRAGGSLEQDLGYAKFRFGFRERLAGAEGGHFTLADNATTLTLTGSNGMAVTAFTASGFAGRWPTSGVALSWRPFNVPVGVRAGWLAEQETLLGTTATGAFGRLAADVAVTGIETGFEIGRWHLAADAEIGTARPNGFTVAIISRMSSLTTSAFALQGHASRCAGSPDRLGPDRTLSQPLSRGGGPGGSLRSDRPYQGWGLCCDSRPVGLPCPVRPAISTCRRNGANALRTHLWAAALPLHNAGPSCERRRWLCACWPGGDSRVL